MKKMLIFLMLICGAERYSDVVRVVNSTNQSVVVIKIENRLRGAGVVVREKVVATASHVVGDTRDIQVVIGDKVIMGFVVFNDPAYDLALISIKTPLRPVKLCVDPMVGEVAIAIGHPNKMINSVTTGVVSGLDRTIDSVKELIQTSACLNPGNSGGPLFNINGELLGINILTQRNGVGYAVSSTNIKRALE